MKKYLMIVVLAFLFFIGNVYADQAVTMDSFVNAVNSGEVTREFSDELKISNTFFKVNASNLGDKVSIEFSFTKKVEKNEETVSSSIDLKYFENGNYLETIDSYSLDTLEDGYYEKVYELIPLWGVEATGNFKTLRKLIDDSKVKETLSTIFDRCYYEEMGVCYTSTKDINSKKITVRVDMSDKAYNYAFKYLKNKKAEDEEKDFSAKLLMIGMVALVVLVFAIAIRPKGKKKKYDAIPIITK